MLGTLHVPHYMPNVHDVAMVTPILQMGRWSPRKRIDICSFLHAQLPPPFSGAFDGHIFPNLEGLGGGYHAWNLALF